MQSMKSAHSSDPIEAARPAAAKSRSRLSQLFRRWVSRSSAEFSVTLLEPSVQRVLRQIQAFGYDVRVWRTHRGDGERVLMSASSGWAGVTHVVSVPAAVDAEHTAVAALAEAIASELEG